MFFSPGGSDDLSRVPRAMRVLVADDNRDQVLTLLAVLRGEGYEARGVHDGRAVLDAARDFEPDVFLLDIGMPEMSGYDVARELRKRYGAAPTLIAVTAYAQSSDRFAARIAGFNHHVAKPFEVGALLDLLKTVQPAAGR